MLSTVALMPNKNKSIKLKKLLNLKEIKEMLSSKMLSNTKRSLMLKMKRFKIATKLKMKQEKLITKECSNSIYKMIKSDGLEVSETKRKTSILIQLIDRKESPRREKKFQIQPIQTRNKLRHVIILLSTAINLSHNLVLVNHHLKKLPNNLTPK